MTEDDVFRPGVVSSYEAACKAEAADILYSVDSLVQTQYEHYIFMSALSILFKSRDYAHTKVEHTFERKECILMSRNFIFWRS